VVVKNRFLGGLGLVFSKDLELKKIVQALRESEEDYRSLIDNMADGFACCQMIFDKEGKPIDLFFKLMML
jgi:PAS domain-containing protein